MHTDPMGYVGWMVIRLRLD